ncbi:MAG TPA: SIS domain-containing protein [Acetobacteraceae bacterium]|nr:SIS domain-containing protein [Acetobacteraceae bacterium]
MSSLMLAEALAAPDAVARFLAADEAAWAAFGACLRAADPRAAITVARGSSDHAASYLAYLLTARLGRPVASLSPSLVTLYHAPLRAQGLFAVALSQSGQSPDILAGLRALRRAGAIAAALVNDTASPLADIAAWCFGLHAGAERAVAATKSFLASLAAAARLVGIWQGDARFLASLAGLPGRLACAAEKDWSAAIPPLAVADRAIVVSRGPGLAIAAAAALKFKETCGLHAEAISGAELRHGPMALIGPKETVLVLAMRGPALAELVSLAAELRESGAKVVLAAPDEIGERSVTLTTTDEPDLDPLAAVQSFYPLAASLAEARGMNPDAPPHLSKVTRTL